MRASTGISPRTIPRRGDQGARNKPDRRPLLRIGGGDLATLAVDPKNENVVYSASIVFWRTENGGATWSAVRGSPGGDDYQKVWVNPNDPNILLLVSDQGAVVSSNRGASWSNWYTQSTAAMYHVSTDASFRVSRVRRPAGLGIRVRRQPIDGWRDHLPRLASRGHPGVRHRGAGSEGSRQGVREHAHATSRSTNRKTGQITYIGPDATRARHELQSQRAHDADQLVAASITTCSSTRRTRCGRRSIAGTAGRASAPISRAQSWDVPATAGKYASTVTVHPQGAITALSPSPRNIGVLWAGTDDGTIQTTTNGGATWTNVTPPQIKPWTRIFNIEAGTLRRSHRVRRREHAAHR